MVRSREIGNNPLIVYVSWPSISEPWAIISKSNIFKLWPQRAVGSVHKNNRVINIDFSLRKRLYPVIFESVLEGGSENSYPPMGLDTVFVPKKGLFPAFSCRCEQGATAMQK